MPSIRRSKKGAIGRSRPAFYPWSRILATTSGRSTEKADHGAIPLEKFKTGHYDVILMDIQMPVMDSYTATKEIRKWERDRGLPPTRNIALTALALKEEATKILESGCNTHITKPVKKATLLEVLQAYEGRAIS